MKSILNATPLYNLHAVPPQPTAGPSLGLSWTHLPSESFENIPVDDWEERRQGEGRMSALAILDSGTLSEQVGR